MLDTPTDKSLVRTRLWASVPEYEETLNLVKNTLNITEAEALGRAGYSGAGNSSKWRKDGRIPLTAINALRGLLFGHQLKQTDDRQPLKMTTEQIEILLHALSQLGAQPNDNVRRLRASLHRELARRLDS